MIVCASGFGMYHDVMNIAIGHGIFGAQLMIKSIFFAFNW